jgi:triosephosphate isomerase
VWAQHVDAVERGRATGWFPPEIAKETGTKGVLLNHSEHKLSVGALGETLSRCKELGLKTLVFADSVEEANVVAKFEPDYIGYEPPELVGSKTTSVARSKPDVIEKVVKAIPDIPILIGAGVKDRKDIEVGLQRGAKAVGLSSAVVLSENPKKVLQDLAAGFDSR